MSYYPFISSQLASFSNMKHKVFYTDVFGTEIKKQQEKTKSHFALGLQFFTPYVPDMTQKGPRYQAL